MPRLEMSTEEWTAHRRYWKQWDKFRPPGKKADFELSLGHVGFSEEKPAKVIGRAARAEGKQEETQGCGHHRNQSKEALLKGGTITCLLCC